MEKIKLTKDKACQWYSNDSCYAKGYLFTPDGRLYRDENLLSYFGDIADENDFRSKLLSANGVFSVIINQENTLWVAVDRVRYFPLFYRFKGEQIYIADEIRDLYEPDEQKELDPDSALLFRGLGYVLKNKTLLKDAFQIQAGEYLSYINGKLTSAFYHLHRSEKINIGFDEAKEQLKNILQNVGSRMTQVLGDRLALLSLSGGFDSRLIAYLLKKEGVKNVLCFTYGKKEDNPEWKRSEMVAKKLGYEWLFIDYGSIDNQPLFHKQKQFVDYCEYASQYVSKFGVTQYFAANYLIENVKIPTNPVCLAGHGGDFFSGSYLRPFMQKYHSLSAMAKDLQLSDFHIGNMVQLTGKERKKIVKLIRKDLLNFSPLFQSVENWELKEREAKYVFPFNKLWEYRGIDSYMPLCDTELMDFFISLPFEYRLNQKLYKTVLSELFAEFDINFPQDESKLKAAIIQQIKIFIKRTFPFLKKKPNLFLYDYFDFKRFSQPLLKELEEAGEKRKILSLNGIFSEWYLMQIKKKLQNEKVD
ncbi:MAG: asparagine synthase C-terminal domain-containing protein [Candidatus Symbiothrix sp.]|jgi:asparagine synthase (glutamine-hydrolysing)|nr:asparagine synthase C-terminal domain-containing protein [Candidatus Symbiothrix sp.]